MRIRHNSLVHSTVRALRQVIGLQSATLVVLLLAGEGSSCLLDAQANAERKPLQEAQKNQHLMNQAEHQARSTLLARMIGRTFPDTSDGVCVFNDQIQLSGLTESQVQFAATHYAGCQKMTRRGADRLRSINPKFLILHYRLGLALGYRSPDNQCQATGEWIQIIRGDWTREWPGEEALEESWFYHYGGQRVYNCDWGWYLMDPDHSGWREFWITQLLDQLEQNDDDGLFADSVSVPNALGADRYTPQLPSFDPVFEGEWSRRIEDWILFVKAQFQGRYTLIPNVGAWVTTRDQTDYSRADGVMIEGFSQWGPGQPFALDDWKLQMNRILNLSQQNRIILAQSYLQSAEDVTSRLFYLGNYLLIKGGHTFLNMELSLEPEWFPEYAIPIGQPLEPPPPDVDALRFEQTQVYARSYSNGLVLVNPAGNVQELNLGRSCFQLLPSGGGIVPQDGDTSVWQNDIRVVESVTIPPHEAAILLYSRP
jgi:hypothetical protein